MSAINLALQKSEFPTMMRLSIKPRYDVSNADISYDGINQVSNVSAMAGSWCTQSTSTWKTFSPNDSDQQEDD